MTTITLKLKLPGEDVSKASALIVTGQIASALISVDGVEIVDVTDDSAPVAVAPVPARRRRGPNKPKPQAQTDAKPNGADEPRQVDASEIPGFLDQRSKTAAHA